MLLYISAYGFTVKRFLTSVFMLWMAIVFVLNVVQQRRELPFVQYAVFVRCDTFLCSLRGACRTSGKCSHALTDFHDKLWFALQKFSD